jgi:1-acyl-sn-glycerol-3-phosphate acyltransferase
LKPAASFVATAWATVSFYTICQLYHALVVVAVLLSLLIGARVLVRPIVWVWSRGLFWLLGTHVHLRGREHMAPGRRYILAANHSSLLDIPALMQVEPHLAWLGREKLLRVPVFGRALRLYGYVPIRQGDRVAALAALGQAVETASGGGAVGIFPEGTRTSDGALQPFKRGLAHIVRNCDLDVLPVTLNGFHALKPKDRWTVRPERRLEAVVGAPLGNAELRAVDDGALLERVRSVIAASHVAA